LSDLAPSELHVLKLIQMYLRYRSSQKGREQKCFTYRGLQGYYTANHFYRYMHWHTVERVIRKLAQKRILLRYDKTLFGQGAPRRKTLFCWTSIAQKLIDEYESRFNMEGVG